MTPELRAAWLRIENQVRITAGSVVVEETETADDDKARAGADLGIIWSALTAAEARELPDPTAGCSCTWHVERDPYEPHIPARYEQEYDPACPEHSKHLYEPRQGEWVLRSSVDSEAKVLRRAELRMFYDTDNDPLDDDSELPVGELRRLLWLPVRDLSMADLREAFDQ